MSHRIRFTLVRGGRRRTQGRLSAHAPFDTTRRSCARPPGSQSRQTAGQQEAAEGQHISIDDPDRPGRFPCGEIGTLYKAAFKRIKPAVPRRRCRGRRATGSVHARGGAPGVCQAQTVHRTVCAWAHSSDVGLTADTSSLLHCAGHPTPSTAGTGAACERMKSRTVALMPLECNSVLDVPRRHRLQLSFRPAMRFSTGLPAA